MSDNSSDSGAQLPPPEPESEPGAADTEAVASAAFATGTEPGNTPRTQEPPETPPDASSDASSKTAVGQEESREPEPPGAHPPQGTYPSQGAPMPSGPAYGPLPSVAPGYPTYAELEFPTRAAKGRRGRWIAGLGVGYVVLAAGTAFGVIAGHSPAPVDVTAVNASVYAAPLGSPGASSLGTASAKASPSKAASTTAAPTSAAPTSASPTSTVTGSVSDGVHSGDLRYFLLPPPQGSSSVQGDPDGTTESLSDLVSEYGGSSDVRSFLKQSDFKAACTRTYQDSSMGANVTIELIQFGSSSGSSDWMSGFQLNGDGFKSISVPGESGASGWSYQKDGQYQLTATYREGDTFFQVTIYATQSIPASDLGQVVSAEHSRLADG